MTKAERAIAAAVAVVAVSGLVVARSESPPADGPNPRVSASHDFYDRRPLRQDKGVVPTEAAAKALLTQMVTMARTGDAVRFCELVHPPLLCYDKWQDIGEAAVPTSPPHLLDAYVQDGGRVLVVCGRDGRGDLYRSEMPVYQFEGRTLAILGPYWYSFQYSGIKGGDEPIHVTPGPRRSVDAATCERAPAVEARGA